MYLSHIKILHVALNLLLRNAMAHPQIGLVQLRVSYGSWTFMVSHLTYTLHVHIFFHLRCIIDLQCLNVTFFLDLSLLSKVRLTSHPDQMRRNTAVLYIYRKQWLMLHHMATLLGIAEALSCMTMVMMVLSVHVFRTRWVTATVTLYLVLQGLTNLQHANLTCG